MSGIRTTEEFLAPDPSSPFSLVLSLKTSGKLGPSLHPKGGGWRLQLAVALIIGIVGLVGAGLLHLAVAGPPGASVLAAAGASRPVKPAKP